jgi:hypothetical protein
MLAKAKEIVIDKDAFIGINADELCSFAKHHLLILPATLPATLLYECTTTERAERSKLIARFERLTNMGARVCLSVEAIIRWEAEHLLPYRSIAVKREDCGINTSARLLEVLQKRYEEHVRQLKGTCEGYHDKLLTEHPDLLSKVKTWDASKGVYSARLRCWLEDVDSESMHEWSQKLLEGITPTPDRFCLSGDWVTWHFLRLHGVILLEQAFLTHHGGVVGARRLEHDLQDIL